MIRGPFPQCSAQLQEQQVVKRKLQVFFMNFLVLVFPMPVTIVSLFTWIILESGGGGSLLEKMAEQMYPGMKFTSLSDCHQLEVRAAQHASHLWHNKHDLVERWFKFAFRMTILVKFLQFGVALNVWHYCRTRTSRLHFQGIIPMMRITSFLIKCTAMNPQPSFMVVLLV
jgi:hypothetical protein